MTVPSESDALALIEIVAGAANVAPLVGVVRDTVGALLGGAAHVGAAVVNSARITAPTRMNMTVSDD
jgi:hypothetical protein